MRGRSLVIISSLHFDGKPSERLLRIFSEQDISARLRIVSVPSGASRAALPWVPPDLSIQPGQSIWNYEANGCVLVF